jgi:hypothetical protein
MPLQHFSPTAKIREYSDIFHFSYLPLFFQKIQIQGKDLGFFSPKFRVRFLLNPYDQSSYENFGWLNLPTISLFRMCAGAINGLNLFEKYLLKWGGCGGCVEGDVFFVCHLAIVFTNGRKMIQ